MREIVALVAALDFVDQSYRLAVSALRAVEKRLAQVQRQRRLAISALRETLRGILGSEVIDAFEHCVVLDESVELKELARLVMGEGRIEVPLDRLGLLMLEVRRIGGELLYSAWRTSKGKGILFKDQAQCVVSEVESILGREVPFEVEEG